MGGSAKEYTSSVFFTSGDNFEFESDSEIVIQIWRTRAEIFKFRL